MFRWLVLALATSGCDLAFGLETVEPVASTVTGTYRYRTVFNDATYQPMTEERILDVGSFILEAILDDGTESPVDYRADGSFSFPVGYLGQAYRVIAIVDGKRNEYQHDAPHLTIGHHVAGRPDRRPPAATYVTFNYAGAGPARISSTGLYSYSDTEMSGPTVTFDWRLASPVFGALDGLLDAAEFDRIYALEYEPSIDGGSPPFSRVTAMSSMSITQAAQTTSMLPQPQPVTPNTCVHLVLDGEAEKLRINSADPTHDYYESKGDWYAYATPAPEFVGMSGALYPANCGFPLQNIDIKPPFHDPYPGTTLVVEAATVLYFYIQVGGATALSMANSTRHYAVADRAEPTQCDSVLDNMQPQIALVGKFELDGASLVVDNKEIKLDPERSPTLTWEVLADGTLDMVAVALHEVQAINGKTTLIPRSGVQVFGASARIDRALLEAGRTYIIGVTTLVGRPNAATGDFLTIQPPFEYGQIWTHTFVAR